MSRLKNMVMATLGAVGIAAGPTACADNDASLFIEGILVAEPPGCTVTADPSSTMLGADALDVAFSFEYQAWLLVGNNLIPRSKKEDLRVEIHNVVLKGAEVTLTSSDGATLDAFSVPGAGFVHPNESEEAGYGAFLTTLIPQPRGLSLSNDLAAIGQGASRTVIANVRVFGDTLGGDELESAEYSFPIEVCYGCSIHYPLDAIDRATATPRCTASTETTGELPCFAGQGTIDCRLCAATNDLCLTVP